MKEKSKIASKKILDAVYTALLSRQGTENGISVNVTKTNMVELTVTNSKNDMSFRAQWTFTRDPNLITRSTYRNNWIYDSSSPKNQNTHQLMDSPSQAINDAIDIVGGFIWDAKVLDTLVKISQKVLNDIELKLKSAYDSLPKGISITYTVHKNEMDISVRGVYHNEVCISVRVAFLTSNSFYTMVGGKKHESMLDAITDLTELVQKRVDSAVESSKKWEESSRDYLKRFNQFWFGSEKPQNYNTQYDNTRNGITLQVSLDGKTNILTCKDIPMDKLDKIIKAITE